jgi:GNAT superfamily N-acetyltransferase
MSDITFSTEDYEKCKGDLLAIRNANRDTAQDATYIAWRYEQRPVALKPIIVFASNDAGDKIGSLSVIPHEYVINGDKYTVGILGDISVNKNWRGRGVTEAMLNYLSALPAWQQLETCIVLPNESAARPLQRADWHTITRLSRYVKVLDVNAALQRWLGPTRVANWLAFLSRHILRLLSIEILLKRHPEYAWEAADSPDGRVDRLWRELDKQGTVIGVRDSAYLTWRYAAHPTARYRIFYLLKQSQVCGYVIFQLSEDRCIIEDWLCDGNSQYTVLLSLFVKYLREHQAASSISIMINEAHAVKTVLHQFGFIKRRDQLRFMIKSHGGRSNTGILSTAGAWFLTSGDKDV